MARPYPFHRPSGGPPFPAIAGQEDSPRPHPMRGEERLDRVRHAAFDLGAMAANGGQLGRLAGSLRRLAPDPAPPTVAQSAPPAPSPTQEQ